MHDIHMTAEEFETARHKLSSMSGLSIDLTRLIWVEGKDRQSARTILGMSRQSAYQALKRATKLVSGVPESWRKFDEFVPPELEDEFREKLAQAYAELGMKTPC